MQRNTKMAWPSPPQLSRSNIAYSFQGLKGLTSIEQVRKAELEKTQGSAKGKNKMDFQCCLLRIYNMDLNKNNFQ